MRAVRPRAPRKLQDQETTPLPRSTPVRILSEPAEVREGGSGRPQTVPRCRSEWVRPRGGRDLFPVLFAVTLFAGAALLFLVQPLVGKLLLPLVGGSPGVWNTG